MVFIYPKEAASFWLSPREYPSRVIVPSSQHSSRSTLFPSSFWRAEAESSSEINHEHPAPSLSLVFIMAELFGMIPGPICCLHVYFGSALETSSSWQWLWKEPVKLKQVLLLLLLSSPSAKTSFSFLPSHRNRRRHRRGRAGLELWEDTSQLCGCRSQLLLGLGQPLKRAGMDRNIQDCRRNGME